MAVRINAFFFFIMAITVLSVNVGGLRVPERCHDKLYEIAQYKTDFVLLQETHLDDEAMIKAYFPDSGIYHSPSGSKFTRGVCVIARGDPEPTECIIDPAGRYVILRLVKNNQECMLISAYAPSGRNKADERLRFFHHLATTAPTPSMNEIVFCGGDFNMLESRKDMHPSPSVFVPDKSIPGLQHLVDALHIEDKWRLVNPYSTECTHHARPGVPHTRLDRVYLTRWLANEFKIKHVPFSQGTHYSAVHVKVEMTDEPARGKGFWHFNNTLTEDKEYCRQFQSWWTDWRLQKANFENLAQWWDEGKAVIADLTREYSREKSRNKRKHITSIHKRLRNLANKNQSHCALAEQLRQTLTDYQKQEAEAARIRAKAQAQLRGEKCTKDFFALEKGRRRTTLMASIRTADGRILDDQQEILEEVRDFYRQLYEEEPIEEHTLDEMLLRIKTKVLPEARITCETPVSLKNLADAVKCLPNGKSPGLDGLTGEFYKTFWHIIGEDLLDTWNFCTERGEMTDSQRQAVISCLYKKGDRDDIGNWRPISLLNLDYKIFTKALAEKLAASLDHVINPQQTASVPGRSMLTTLALARDLIDYAYQENIPASLVSIDQAKAFDRVNWKFLHKTLLAFGYGPKFVNIIKMIYNNISSRVKVNGHLSQAFRLSRGVRQGCPLSMLLYCLLSEVFANYLSACGRVKGIRFPRANKVGDATHWEIKICQFADDTYFFLKDSDSLQQLQQLLQMFERATGAKINQDKCKGLWLGRYRAAPTTRLDTSGEASLSRYWAFICSIPT